MRDQIFSRAILLALNMKLIPAEILEFSYVRQQPHPILPVGNRQSPPSSGMNKAVGNFLVNRKLFVGLRLTFAVPIKVFCCGMVGVQGLWHSFDDSVLFVTTKAIMSFKSISDGINLSVGMILVSPK